MKKRILLGILISCFVVVVVILSGLGGGHGPGYESFGNIVGKKAPSIYLNNISEGRNKELIALKGKRLTIIMLWSTKCLLCEKNIKLIKEAKEKYQLRTIGILYKDERQKALNYLESLGDPFDEIYEESSDNTFSEAFKVISLGENIVVDGNGIILKKFYVEELSENLMEYLEELVRKKTGEVPGLPLVSRDESI